MPTATISWGDGRSQVVPVVPASDSNPDWTIGDVTHEYAQPGSYLVVISGPYGGRASTRVDVAEVAEPNIVIGVPASQALSRGIASAPFDTTLKNTGGDAGTVTETITLKRADGGNLAPADVVYETKDQGGSDFATLPFVSADGGKSLVATETFPVGAGLDATSEVRITINVVGDIKGTSAIKDADGAPLATATYTFSVTEVA